ncbi:MAG: cyclic nucleotide-binding domain-containing protein [Acidobacteriota bacterium]|nr:cyclic nucleotide-binding domain-containing protein [Acidobacteriota bacterium]
MKIGPTRAAIDYLYEHLAAKDYGKALRAIESELAKNPDQLNLRLRQAEILDLSGDRKRAIFILHNVAETQARDGFYARAIAIYKKILRLDPEQDVHSQLAQLIEDDRASKTADHRRRKTEAALGERASENTQELKELAASSLFASFKREALVEVLASTELRSYDTGDIIVTEGESGSSLFLIVSGVVKVFTKTEDGVNLQLAELGLGDFFGEVSLLTGKPRTATITAHTDVTAIELDRTNFEAIVENHPEARTTLENFYNLRAEKTVEAVIQGLRGRNSSGREAPQPE